MVSHSLKFQPPKWRFSLWNSTPLEAPNVTWLPPFWTVLNSQVMFSWCHTVQGFVTILFKDYHSWLWLLLSHITCTFLYSKPNMRQTLKDTNNLNNTLEKLHFSDLVKDAKPVADFSASRQVGWTDVTQTGPGCQIVNSLICSYFDEIQSIKNTPAWNKMSLICCWDFAKKGVVSYL